MLVSIQGSKITSLDNRCDDPLLSFGQTVTQEDEKKGSQESTEKIEIEKGEETETASSVNT